MIAPILVVAMPDSVHTLRWLQTVRSGTRPLVLLPATTHPVLSELSSLPRITCARDAARLGAGDVGIFEVPDEAWTEPPDPLPAPIGFNARAAIVRGTSVARAIRALRPILIHSMEIQLAGYACLQAARLIGGEFPRWLVSNWGSDVFLYEKLAEHRPVLMELAQRADGFVSECQRDIAIVRRLGFKGQQPFVLPASGGANFEDLQNPATAPSSRREIVVKGYHGWSGRALHILSALHLAAPTLDGFQIRVVLASRVVADTADKLSRISGLDIEAEPWHPEHDTALARMARARLMIGVGISDGIGTTLLEAMALGVFPIVASTSCAGEWIRSGVDGFIVNPHDVDEIAQAITRAATDDVLVDAAAPRNRAEVERRWNARMNSDAALAIYKAVVEGHS
jgi:Glycosyl transferases group 1